MNKTQKDIRQCPLYPRYYADAEGRVYLDGSGEQEVRVCTAGGHLMTTTGPRVKVHRIVYYAFNPDAPVEGYDIHHINEVKVDNRLENLVLLTHGEHMRLHHTGEKNPHSKPVLQYTKEGVLVTEYTGVHEAERQTGVHCAVISKVCLYKCKTAGGFIWRFKDDPLLPEQLSLHNGISQPKPVLQYTKEGVFIAEYASAREASRATGIINQSISNVCHHKKKSTHGYIFRFKDDPLPPPEPNLKLF